MRVLILGATGMLGNAVAKHFQKKDVDLYFSYRNPHVIFDTKSDKPISYYPEAFPFETKAPFIELPYADYVINCIGVIKPFIEKNPIESIEVNSIFPRALANYCEKNKMKLIQITTDCVFSGKDGPYTEDSPHDALDDYGKTKSLGEPKNCMVLRTSIIGEEIHKGASLISWVNTLEGQEANGFTNHWWNGMTTEQYAKVCSTIIEKDLFENGTFHLFSNRINKHDLVKKIAERFDIDVKLNKYEAPVVVDRTLASNKSLINKLNIPSIEEQIESMALLG